MVVAVGPIAKSVRLAPHSVGLDVSTSLNHRENSFSWRGGGRWWGVPLSPSVPAKNLFVFSSLARSISGKYLCFSLLGRKNQKTHWLKIQGPRDQGNKGPKMHGPRRRRTKNCDQKRERGGDEPPRKDLVEVLWEQYAPGGGNYMQNGGGKFWGRVRYGMAFIGTDPARPWASSCQLKSGVSPHVPRSEGSFDFAQDVHPQCGFGASRPRPPA